MKTIIISDEIEKKLEVISSGMNYLKSRWEINYSITIKKGQTILSDKKYVVYIMNTSYVNPENEEEHIAQNNLDIFLEDLTKDNLYEKSEEECIKHANAQVPPRFIDESPNQ